MGTAITRDCLIYTFRTNKRIAELRAAGYEIFVFGKLKQDLATFEQLILSRRPQQIVGLAHLGRRTQLEAFAVNKFNQGTISQNGAETYSLFIPQGMDIHVNTEPYATFCNWASYRIEELLEKHEIATKHSFLHFRKTLLTENLLKYLNRLAT